MAIDLTTRHYAMLVDLLIASLLFRQRQKASNAQIKHRKAAMWATILSLNWLGCRRFSSCLISIAGNCKVRSEVVSGLILSGWAVWVHARRKRHDASSPLW